MAASDAAPKAAYVYMVRCAGGLLYTGWSTDPAARLRAHRSGKGAKYTRAHGAAALAYVERCADKPAALRREYALKHLPKAQKETLCAAWAAAGRPQLPSEGEPFCGSRRVYGFAKGSPSQNFAPQRRKHRK